ncbi:MAG: 2-oxoacid:acceptor oxidoreductase family protein [Desulfurococcaceae archaeon]
MLHEIIFLGRGGQGAVTASNILVQAAIYENKYGQGFPFFGAERRGAPVTAYARISDKPVLKHGMFNEADVLVVFDDSLLKLGITKRFRLRNNAVLIVNTALRHIDKEQLTVAGAVKVYTVNATRIARDLGLVIAGWPLVNTAILGSLAAATRIVSVQSIEKAILDYLGSRLGEKNVKAARSAYEETAFLGEV